MPVRFTDVTESFLDISGFQCLEGEWRWNCSPIFSPDGQHLVILSRDNTPSFMLHKRTGETSFSRLTNPTAPDKDYRPPAFSKNGQYLMAGFHSTQWPNVAMFLRDGDTYNHTSITMNDGGDNWGTQVRGLAISSDGTYMVHFYHWASPALRLWKRDGTTWNLIAAGLQSYMAEAGQLAVYFTPDDEYAISIMNGNYDSTGSDGVVFYKMSANSWAQQTIQQLHTGPYCPMCSAMSKDGTLIALGGWGGYTSESIWVPPRIQVYSRNGATLTRISECFLDLGLDSGEYPTRLAFSEDNQYIVATLYGSRHSPGTTGNLWLLKWDDFAGEYKEHEATYNRPGNRYAYYGLDIIPSNPVLGLTGNDYIVFTYQDYDYEGCPPGFNLLTTLNPLVGISNLQAVEEEITHNEALIGWDADPAAEEYFIQYREVLPEE